jgi:hypothetical protein
VGRVGGGGLSGGGGVGRREEEGVSGRRPQAGRGRMAGVRRRKNWSPLPLSHDMSQGRGLQRVG